MRLAPESLEVHPRHQQRVVRLALELLLVLQGMVLVKNHYPKRNFCLLLLPYCEVALSEGMVVAPFYSWTPLVGPGD